MSTSIKTRRDRSRADKLAGEGQRSGRSKRRLVVRWIGFRAKRRARHAARPPHAETRDNVITLRWDQTFGRDLQIAPRTQATVIAFAKRLPNVA
jgi:hypothetical protein